MVRGEGGVSHRLPAPSRGSSVVLSATAGPVDLPDPSVEAPRTSPTSSSSSKIPTVRRCPASTSKEYGLELGPSLELPSTHRKPRHGVGQLHFLKESPAVARKLRDLVPHVDEGVTASPSLVHQDEDLPPSSLSIHPGEPGEHGLDEFKALNDRGKARRIVLPIVARRVDDDPGLRQAAQRSSIDW